MARFLQKLVCIYNQTSSKHHLESLISGESILKPVPVFGQISLPYGVVQNDLHYPMQVIDSIESYLQTQEVMFYDFSSIFAKLTAEFYRHYDRENGLENVTKEIFIPQLNQYCNFESLSRIKDCIPISYIEGSFILIRFIEKEENRQFVPFDDKQNSLNNFHENYQPEFLTDNEYQNLQSSSKQKEAIPQEETKDRDRTRTIGEVINYVRKWRDLSDNGLNGHKVNLQDAAVHVGIPKKSLDDYYYQLRIGEKYEFDFERNMDKNISFLRKFVKTQVPNRNHRKEGKEPKTQECHENNSESSHNTQSIPKKLFSFQDQKLTETPCLTLPSKCGSEAPTFVMSEKNANPSTQQTELENDLESIGEVSNKMYRLSESDVSSINQAWPINFNQKEDPIFNDEDSFFEDFRFGNDFEEVKLGFMEK